MEKVKEEDGKGQGGRRKQEKVKVKVMWDGDWQQSF